MAEIKIVSNMAFDAISLIEYIHTTPEFYKNHYGVEALPEQKIFGEKIDGLTLGELDGCANRVNMCMAFTTFYHKKEDLEHCCLDDLAEFFEEPRNVRDSMVKYLSELFPGYYAELEFNKLWEEHFLPRVKKYKKHINVLKRIGFDILWKSDLLPLIQNEIAKKEETYKSLDIAGTFADIQKLKQDSFEKIKIYVSLMTYPTAFRLPGYNFLDTFKSSEIMGAGIICHEMMHGFINRELENLYLNYIGSNEYLIECHSKVSRMNGVNEEDLVNAAEYYLRMKHNDESKKNLLKEAKERYSGCLPTSVFLFDLLSKETETPNGYVEWLIDIFKNKKLPQDNIKQRVDDIIANLK